MTLTYFVIEHAQWKQHMALSGAVGENAEFVALMGFLRDLKPTEQVFCDFRLFGGIKHLINAYFSRFLCL